MSSLSRHYREEGNGFYKQACREELPNCLKKSYFSDAMVCYNKAFNSSRCVEEKTSAAKNLGMVSWKLAEVHQNLLAKVTLLQYYFKEALRYIDRALVLSRDCKPEAWKTSLKENLQLCIQSAVDVISELPFKEKLMSLESYTSVISDSTQKAELYLEISQQIFRHSVITLQEGEYKKALSSLKDSYMPTEEAKRLAGGDEHILSEAKIVEEDCFLHMCSAESIQARTLGDELLDSAINDEEDFNMTMILDVLDLYKKAILLTREKEVEMEAIALSRMGHVYDEVLKNKTKAKDYFMRSVQLAYSLHPRTFHSQVWFTDATTALERYQQEVVEEENKQWQKKRQQFVKELEKELKELKVKQEKNHDGDLSNADLLRWVYKTYPPKRKSHKLPNEKDLEKQPFPEMKKIFQKAVIHYHPDKQKEHGDKWVVLCEEITKVFTAKYERFK